MTAPVEQVAASEKIAMTAPVTQEKSGDRWRVAFVLPSSYTLGTAPQPDDARVTLALVPERLVAAVRYSGTGVVARYEENLQALERFIVEQGLEPTGEPDLRALRSALHALVSAPERDPDSRAARRR